MRKAAYAIAALLVVLGVAVVLIPRFISLERFRPTAIAALEEKTGRKVHLGRISLSLFPALGVRVSEVSVSGDARHPDEKMLAIPEAEVRLAILPLFSGRAEFTRVVLRRPTIVFRRYADGTHSATDILARLEEPRESAAAAPARPAAGVAVAFDSVLVDDAAFSFRAVGKDGKESAWNVDPLTVKVSGIEGRTKEFRLEARLDGPVRGRIVFAGKASPLRGAAREALAYEVKGDGKLFGQKVFVEGTVSPAEVAREADLRLRMPKVDLGEVEGIFRDPPVFLADARPEGYASLAAEWTGNPDAFGFEVEVDLSRAGWTLDGDVRKFIDTPCTILVQGHRFPDLLAISNAELRAPPLLLIATTAFGPKEGQLEWAASARISSLAEFAKARGVSGPLSPTGRVTASGKGAKADAAAPYQYAVGVDLGDVGFQLPARKLDIRGLDGHVDLTTRAVAFAPVTGLVNGQRFSLRGYVAVDRAPSGQLDLRMAYLDLDALLPPSEEGRKEGKRRRRKGEPGPGRTRELSARVSLAVDAGKARGIEFENLKGIARFEKEALFLDDLTATIYGGTASASGRIGLSEAAPDVRVKVVFKDVAAGEILTRKTKLGDFLAGSVSLSAEIGGGTRDFADFTRTAAGSGSIRVAGGKIRGVDILGTAAGIAGIRGFLPGVAAAAPGPGTAAPGETSFRDLSADFRIGGGKIRTGNLKIVSERLGLAGEAALGFDRTLDFQGTLTLPAGVSERVRGTAGKFLVGPDGKVEIPLVMSGPVNSPAVAIDAQALARGAVDRTVRGLKERIPGLTPDPGRAAPKEAPPEPGRRKKRKAVEDLIERLLPKK